MKATDNTRSNNHIKKEIYTPANPTLPKSTYDEMPFNSGKSPNWRKSPLFSDISNYHFDNLEDKLEELVFSPGDSIIKDGEEGDCLYIIEKGEVEIQKDGIKLAVKKEGEHFGAMALMDDTTRSADVIAVSDTIVKTLTVNVLKELEKEEVYHKVLTNHIKGQQATLRNMNGVAVNEMKKRLEESQNRVRAGKFFVTLVFWLVLYQFLLGIFIEYSNIMKNKALLDILNPSMMIIFGIASYVKAYKSDFPMSAYGLNTYGWKKSIKEALIWTSLFLVGLVLFKWFLTVFVPFYQGKPIFDTSRIQSYSWTTLLIIYIAYAILAPVQEFIARGVIQSSLEKLLSEEKKVFWSILLSNLIFSGFHIHMDMKFAIMTFIPGIFWGVMYHRHGSLVGVSISHILIGLFALLFMGLI